MEALVEHKVLPGAGDGWQDLTTMPLIRHTRLHTDVTRDTLDKGPKSASPRQGGAAKDRTESQSRSDSSQGNVDSGSAPSAVTRTCCSSLTPSVSPTAPM